MRRDDLHQSPGRTLGELLAEARALAEGRLTGPTGSIHVGGDVTYSDSAETKSLRSLGRTQAELDAAVAQAKLDLVAAEKAVAQAKADIDASAGRITAAQAAADQARKDAAAASGLASENTRSIQDQWNATVAADQAVRDAAAADAKAKADAAKTAAITAAATDAKTKADAAQAAAVTAATAAAAQDAAAKDAALKAQTLTESATTAQQKADAAAAKAKADALTVAAADAKSKADAAQAAATAAADQKFADQAGAILAAQQAAQAAQSTADQVKSIADGMVRTHYSPTAPWPDGTPGHDSDIGDMWLRSTDGIALRWTGTKWEILPDSAIAAALKAAQDAQTTADGKIDAFYQPNKPTSAGQGDLWFNTGDKNRPHRCTVGSTTNPTFVPIADGRIADAQTAADQAKAAAAAASQKATDEASAAKVAAIAAAAADADAKDATLKAATLTAAAATAEQKAAAAAATAEANAKTAAALDAKTKADAAQAAATLSAQAATALLKATIDSRGTDLVTNGTGALGDNTNFSAFTVNKADVPTGASASFYAPAGTRGLLTDEAVPFDPAKRYRFAFQMRQTVAGSTDRAYGAVAPYDQWGNAVEPYRYGFHAGTTTTLTADLQPGDTVVKLASVAGWWGTPGKPAGATVRDRSMILWGWTDPNGKVWPEHTYSRRHWAIDQWADGGANPATNTITLKAPWPASAGTVTAGTKVSNGTAGAAYVYMPSLTNGVIPEAWTTYADTYSAGVMGVATAATGRPVATWASGMPPGTARVRLGWQLNYPPNPTNPIAGRHAVAAVSFSDASAAQATADRAVSDAAAASAKATSEAAKAETAAKSAAALDATAKAAQAESAAKTAAATEAKRLADLAQAAAISASGTDATAKAEAARKAAEAAAAADASAKAAAAEAAAKAAAAADATTKADAARAVAEAAQRAADAAKAAADAAKAAADAAQQTASTALTSANGRNAIIVSTVDATGTTHPKTGLALVAGDNWIKEDPTTHHALARWAWSGAEWVPMPISGEMVTNLDVHKLTVSGSARMTQVVADRIIADAAFYGSLTTDRLTAGTGDIHTLVAQQIAAATATFQEVRAKNIVGDGATFRLSFIQDLCAQVITSGLFRTAASGARVEIDGAGLRAYNKLGKKQVELGTDNDFIIVGEGRDGLGRLGAKLGLITSIAGTPVYGLSFTDSDGDSPGAAILAEPDGTVRLAAGGTPGGPQYALRVHQDGVTIGAMGRSQAFRTNVDGVWAGGQRLTPKVITSGHFGYSDPGDYLIRGTISGMPNDFWGTITVRAVDGLHGTNTQYTFRDDFGSGYWVNSWMWTSPGVGRYTGWENLLDPTTRQGAGITWANGNGWAFQASTKYRENGKIRFLSFRAVSPNRTLPAGEYLIGTFNKFDASTEIVGSWGMVGPFSDNGSITLSTGGNVYLKAANPIGLPSVTITSSLSWIIQ